MRFSLKWILAVMVYVAVAAAALGRPGFLYPDIMWCFTILANAYAAAIAVCGRGPSRAAGSAFVVASVVFAMLVLFSIDLPAHNSHSGFYPLDNIFLGLKFLGVKIDPFDNNGNTILRLRTANAIASRASVLTIPPELGDAIGLMNFINDVEEDAGNSDSWFVDIIDDRRFADLSTEDVLKRLPADIGHVCLFIVDRQTISDPDHPILVVDLRSGGSRTFRTIPSEVWAIGSNLPIANMDWEDFAGDVDDQGVFRGHS
jgi:hypothetical protein